MKRSIKQMNLFFEQYDIIIKARPLRFEGDENNIRYFFILYFTAKYNLIDLPFKKKLIYQLEQFYTLVSTIFRNKPTIQDRLNFTLFSAVAYEREKNNHPLVIRNAPKITFLINILNSLPTKFTHLNKIDSKSELDFWIRTFSLFTNNKTFNSTPMLSKNKQKKIFERTGIEQFLFLFSKIFKIELTDNERFTISKELYELLFGFLKPKNIINSLNNHYSAFYKSNDFFLDSYKILTKKIFVHCFSEELFPYFDFFFFVLTTHSISLLDNFYSLFAKINITIYIDFDFQFSIYVQNKLEKLLPGNMNFLLIDSADKLYNTNGISESDLFITNIYNYKSIGIAFKEIYILSHHISEFDIENITDIITEVYKKNYSGIILEGEEILKQYFNTDM
ncbi:hypothetical protein FJU10_11175 [Enterococcus sp. OL5]|nr:hypothetical protein FJU10_11175 [Enterococcus sp. OL5]